MPDDTETLPAASGDGAPAPAQVEDRSSEDRSSEDRSSTSVSASPLEGVENALLQGDLSRLSPEERLRYYRKVCESVGLNPLTRPFEYIRLNGKLTLYAKRDAAEQLRRLNGVSITSMETDKMKGVYLVRAYAQDGHGRTDVATGAVPIDNAKGNRLANALMKAETKAKRRVTLSICGLGWLDETELGTIPSAEAAEVDHETGEIAQNDQAKANAVPPAQQTNAAKTARLISQMRERLEDAAPQDFDDTVLKIKDYVTDGSWPEAEAAKVAALVEEVSKERADELQAPREDAIQQLREAGSEAERAACISDLNARSGPWPEALKQELRETASAEDSSSAADAMLEGETALGNGSGDTGKPSAGKPSR